MSDTTPPDACADCGVAVNPLALVSSFLCAACRQKRASAPTEARRDFAAEAVERLRGEGRTRADAERLVAGALREAGSEEMRVGRAMLALAPKITATWRFQIVNPGGLFLAKLRSPGGMDGEHLASGFELVEALEKLAAELERAE